MSTEDALPQRAVCGDCGLPGVTHIHQGDVVLECPDCGQILIRQYTSVRNV